MKILIKNALILTVNQQNEVLGNADIAIDNGCLQAIGKVSDNFEADKVVKYLHRLIWKNING